MNETQPWWSSSTGSKDIALRVKSFLVALVPVIAMLTPLVENELMKVVAAIVELVAVGTFIFAYARQVIYKQKKLGKYAE